MSHSMTSHERFQRMYEHRDADRVPIIDDIWGSTIARWRREGMPADADPADVFGLDKVALFWFDASPRFPPEVIEETDDYVVRTTPWGVLCKEFKHLNRPPVMLDARLKSSADWPAVKARMTPARDRIDWARLESNYRRWRDEGWWIMVDPYFGFDVTHNHATGTERLLMAMLDEPEWVADIFRTELELCLSLLQLIWDAGYTFDGVRWSDDMGYKGKPFFSLDIYRALLRPVHRRCIDWAHQKGVKAHLHSCGNINAFLPDLVDMGLDGLHPLEVKAGMDPLQLKRTYGDRLLLHGGINAALWDKPDLIQAEIARVVPTMKQKGGYVFSSDHSVPDSVSLADFRAIIESAKRAGSYD